MNESSDNKTDITFELRTVTNLRRSIKEKCHCSHVWYYSHVRYCLCYYSWHCSHRRIDDVALTDEVSQFYWTKILMYCWLVTWQHVIGSKITCMVHAYIQDYFQRNRITVQAGWLFKLRGQTVSLFKLRTIDWWRGAILSVQTVFNPMAMIYSMYL